MPSKCGYLWNGREIALEDALYLSTTLYFCTLIHKYIRRKWDIQISRITTIQRLPLLFSTCSYSSEYICTRIQKVIQDINTRTHTYIYNNVHKYIYAQKYILLFLPRQSSLPFPSCKCLSHIPHIQIPPVDPEISSRAGLSKSGPTAGPCTTSGHDSSVCFNLSQSLLWHWQNMPPRGVSGCCLAGVRPVLPLFLLYCRAGLKAWPIQVSGIYQQQQRTSLASHQDT